MKGIYVILIELDEAKDILVGKKRRFDLQKGFYGYVGSAMSGLERRLGRHLSSMKKPYWHIDYLLITAEIQNIIYAETAEKKECTMAQTLSQRLPAIRGFGCSDCKCPSHLFFRKDYKALENLVFDTLKSLGLYPFVYVSVEAPGP
jgi:Uri superfamily endonuclease